MLVLALHEKGYVTLPEGSRPAIPMKGEIALTADGWTIIDGFYGFS